MPSGKGTIFNAEKTKYLYVASYSTTVPSGVLVFDAAANGDAVPVRNIKGPGTGLGADPHGIAVDSSGNIYVGHDQSITIYDPTADGDAAPLRTIKGPTTDLDGATKLAIDSRDYLYVLNSAGHPRTITVYKPDAGGDVAPVRKLTGIQVGDPGLRLNGIAIDQFDYLYVSQQSPSPDFGGFVSVYAPRADGAAAPVRTISAHFPSGVPSQMGFDSANNLYLSNGADVLVFDPAASGSSEPIRHIIGANTGLYLSFSLAVGSDGVVYVGNASTYSGEEPDVPTIGYITVYSAGATGNAAPIRTIAGPNTGLGDPYAGLAVDKVSHARFKEPRQSILFWGVMHLTSTLACSMFRVKELGHVHSFRAVFS
jgi:hypothetical protein